MRRLQYASYPSPFFSNDFLNNLILFSFSLQLCSLFSYFVWIEIDVVDLNYYWGYLCMIYFILNVLFVVKTLSAFDDSRLEEQIMVRGIDGFWRRWWCRWWWVVNRIRQLIFNTHKKVVFFFTGHKCIITKNAIIYVVGLTHTRRRRPHVLFAEMRRV